MSNKTYVVELTEEEHSKLLDVLDDVKSDEWSILDSLLARTYRKVHNAPMVNVPTKLGFFTSWF